MQPILYFLISLLGASLLFFVQPMAAKAALPILGGAPFVWNGCMVFFQTLLLGGYLYAHLLNKALPVHRQPLVHVPLLAMALLAFPITFAGSGAIDAATEPMLWLLSMLALSVGLPFFVLSATSPLSQRWFAAAMPGREPYVLYAASNVGSFAGLLAYPLVIEPLLPIARQATLLYVGFGLLLALFVATGLPHLLRAPKTANSATRTPQKAPAPHARILSWIALAFVPSSLLYGITSYITTDIASVPLFWVVPLALYLLTFIVAFGARAPNLHRWQTLHRMGAPAMAFLALLPLSYPAEFLLVHLVIFFATALVCHGRLSALKPAPEHLTGFFLWVSFGGVLGGAFNSFLAPAVFATVIEYPLMLVASLAVVNVALPWTLLKVRDALKILAVWISFGGLFWVFGTQMPSIDTLMDGKSSARPLFLALFTASSLVLLMVIHYRTKLRPMVHMAWMVPMLVFTIPIFNALMNNHETLVARNVFGVSRIVYQPAKHAWFFRHGTTYHGVQSSVEAERLKPTSYYAPLIDVFQSLPSALAKTPVAVMGMGVGTIACYGKANQEYDLLEIDPLVEKIAYDTRYFTYLRDCPPKKNIILGDGRISLSRTADGRYGLIILDAFTSDAIPMHLMTREAMAMYAQKLAKGGMIAVNISNRHVDLIPVLAAIAQEVGMVGVHKLSIAPADKPLQLSSRWVVLARDAAALKSLKKTSTDWETLPEADATFLWRDDYSNLLRSMKF